jgi:DNA repair photolyase
MFKRWGRECTPTDIEDVMAMDDKRIKKVWKPAVNREMIFFPSSSDIFYENAKAYVSVCKNIIDAGHEIFYVTKPTLKTMKLIIKEFEKLDIKYKNNMTVFITITSNNNDILKEYEPYASTYEERVKVIELLKKHDFNVNVMIEPYLSDPIELANGLLEVLPKTGVIAIGQMNYMTGIELTTKQKKYLDDLYCNENVKKLWEFAKNNERVFLKKDSVKAVWRVYKK